jgi:CheY-like chemotaxis protein
MKVLVVDDEVDIREPLQEFFQEAGLEVVTAADGVAAMQVLNDGQLPDVVVLDLLMPRMTGNDVYAAMQADPRLARVPVIVSTSDPSRAPSGVLIMKKPVNLERLLAAVRQYGERGDGAQ